MRDFLFFLGVGEVSPYASIGAAYEIAARERVLSRRDVCLHAPCEIAPPQYAATPSTSTLDRSIYKALYYIGLCFLDHGNAAKFVFRDFL